jgi:PhoH-like ATPase
MKKNFVLDTNVLLHDPNAIVHFGDNDVVIPIYVIEEIDHFKKDLSELGRNARVVGRMIDSYRSKGRLNEGVQMSTGGSLKVVFTNRRLPTELGEGQKMDHKILAVAFDLSEKEPSKQTIFITKDTNLRIKADSLGITAQDYDTEKVTAEEIYSGVCELDTKKEWVDDFYQAGHLDLDNLSNYDPIANQFVHLRDDSDSSHGALGRVDPEGKRLKQLLKSRSVWGIQPRNREQTFALDLLLDDRIKLVSLAGKAGTGKTLLALAVGLYKTSEEGLFQRLLVSRPIFPLGRDIGFLPGDIEEKLNPWMQPIFDNVELLMNLTRKERNQGRSYRELVDMGLIDIEPLTYIRGRSIPNQYIIVDEAQNLTPHEVKTIITRAGDQTKVVLTGDLYQIDNPYVDSANNGLAFVVNKFKGEAIAGAVTLKKGERSRLAELASNIL